MDSTFDFAKRRNRPLKYDRDTMMQTLEAMKKVEAIKTARESRFYKDRMKNNKQQHKLEGRKDIEKGIELVAPAMSAQRQAHNIHEKVVQKLDARDAVIAASKRGRSSSSK